VAILGGMLVIFGIEQERAAVQAGKGAALRTQAA